jgi:hypothetical protein
VRAAFAHRVGEWGLRTGQLVETRPQRAEQAGAEPGADLAGIPQLPVLVVAQQQGTPDRVGELDCLTQEVFALAQRQPSQVVTIQPAS